MLLRQQPLPEICVESACFLSSLSSGRLQRLPKYFFVSGCSQ